MTENLLVYDFRFLEQSDGKKFLQVRAGKARSEYNDNTDRREHKVKWAKWKTVRMEQVKSTEDEK